MKKAAGCCLAVMLTVLCVSGSVYAAHPFFHAEKDGDRLMIEETRTGEAEAAKTYEYEGRIYELESAETEFIYEKRPTGEEIEFTEWISLPADDVTLIPKEKKRGDIVYTLDESSLKLQAAEYGESEGTRCKEYHTEITGLPDNDRKHLQRELEKNGIRYILTDARYVVSEYDEDGLPLQYTALCRYEGAEAFTVPIPARWQTPARYIGHALEEYVSKTVIRAEYLCKEKSLKGETENKRKENKETEPKKAEQKEMEQKETKQKEAEKKRRVEGTEETSSRKKIVIGIIAAVAAAAFLLCAAICGGAKGEQQDAHVKVASYTGGKYRVVSPRTADSVYMDNLMQELLAMYNEIRGTEYENWTDEQVRYTTQGRYATEEEWREYLQKKYTEIEKEQAKNDTAQMILAEVAGKSKLLNYTEEDYQRKREAAESQLIYGNGFKSRENMLEGLSLSEEEFETTADARTLEMLKLDYVTEAIAEKEGLIPSEEELEAAREKHMSGVLEMGYKPEDEYYQEERRHWGKEVEEVYKNTLTAEKVRNFLYEHNEVK